MATPRLPDDTKQAAHLRALEELGAFDNDDAADLDADEPSWGCDPLSALLFKEEHDMT